MTMVKPRQFSLRRLMLVLTVLAVVFGIALAIGLQDEDMDAADLLAAGGVTLFLYSCFAMPVFGVIWLISRKRARWSFVELLLLVLPWAVWFVLMMSPLQQLNAGKSLANINEPVFFGPIAGLLPLPKVVLGHRTSYRNAVLLGTSLAVGAAVLIFFLMP